MIKVSAYPFVLNGEIQYCVYNEQKILVSRGKISFPEIADIKELSVYGYHWSCKSILFPPDIEELCTVLFEIDGPHQFEILDTLYPEYFV